MYTQGFAVLSGLGAILIWSLAPAIVKTTTSSVAMNLSEFFMLRYFIAAVISLPWIFKVFKKGRVLTAKQWITLWFYINVSIFLQAYALQFVPLSWYVIIFSLNPLMTFLFMRLKLSKIKIWAIIFSFSGALFFINPIEMQDQPSWLGIFAVVGTMVTWAAFTTKLVDLQRVYKDIELSVITNYLSLTGSFVLWMICSRSFDSIPAQSIGPIAMLSLLMPIAFWLFSFCLRTLPVFGVASQYMELIFGLIIGVYFFGDFFSFIQLVGSFFVILGLVLLVVPDRKQYQTAVPV